MKDNIFYKHFIIDNTKRKTSITPKLFLEYVFNGYFNCNDVKSVISKGGTVQYVLCKNNIELYTMLDSENIFIIQTLDFEHIFEFDVSNKDTEENKIVYEDFCDFFKKYNLNN